MTDAIVVARVPAEIKEQVDGVLEKMGATSTQLINAAYEYVLSQGELPLVQPDQDNNKRNLSLDEQKQLAKSIRASSFAVSESFWGDESDKDRIGRDRRVDYETLV